MSTSLRFYRFGQRQVEYVKTTFDANVIHLHRKPKPEAVRCPACHSPALRWHSQKERCFRLLPIRRKRVELVMPIPRVECENRGAVRQNLPRAARVYDAFHVIQLFNHHLSQSRRDLYSHSKN